jgi:hypothetical protein
VINYQGRLTDATGNPVADGPQLMKFIIYDAPTGGVDLWGTGFETVQVVNGLFSVQLGAPPMPVLPNDLFAGDTTRFLGITVGTNPENTPRIKLTSVAYAYHSLRSDIATTVDNGPGIATGDSLVTSYTNLTSTNVDIDSVTIEAPTAGYVVVIASAYYCSNHANGQKDLGRFWITTVPTTTNYNFMANITTAANAETDSDLPLPVSLHAVYSVDAGTHKYYLGADAFVGNPRVSRGRIVAMFFPTAYGDVITSPSVPVDAGAYDNSSSSGGR